MSRALFIFDSNALISAHLIPGFVSAKAYLKALETGIIVRSPDTFIEFSTRSLRKRFEKYVTLEKRIQVVETYKKQTLLVRPTVPFSVCRDPDDNKYLELAYAVNATCIVTGDSDLLVLHPFEQIPILSPSDFVNFF